MSTILLVDPDRGCRDRYQRELEADGHRVKVASSAAEAIRRLTEEVPALMISEACLPGIDGLDLMFRARSIDARLPIIFNSSSAWYMDNFQSWAADAYVLKSPDPGPLRSAVNSLVRPAGTPPAHRL